MAGKNKFNGDFKDYNIEVVALTCMHHVYICQFFSFNIVNSSLFQCNFFHGIKAILFESVKLCVSSF